MPLLTTAKAKYKFVAVLKSLLGLGHVAIIAETKNVPAFPTRYAKINNVSSSSPSVGRSPG
jgi:hypothetical protein